ncbi:MAG: helix-turn-helix transcriptional regulator [Firmicutes bacterium]|nr:helix-turn-helix transcriptional regulator [Bacillota bacterium]
MDVSQATVSNWCRGIKIPRMNKIDKIAVFFKVKRSYILEEHSNEYILYQKDLPLILHLMEQLNNEGQEKVVEYAEELIALGKYKKHGRSKLGQKEV